MKNLLIIAALISLSLAACTDLNPVVLPTGVAPQTPLSATLPPLPTYTPTQPPVYDCIPTETLVQHGELVDVIDGDTIDVRLEDGDVYRVRYIGVDTPEHDEEFYEEASSLNETLLLGESLTLVKDVSETDRYDRLLRYVLVGDTFVNYELVRQGYAVSVTFPPDLACETFFRQTERDARDQGVGLWAEQP